MTTYGEAFQMALGANLAVGVMNEVTCAGDVLSRAMETNGEFDAEALPVHLREALSHVLGHLVTIRSLTSKMDEFYDVSLTRFDAMNPGKLGTVSKEISEATIIREMQDIVGMTEAQRVAMTKKNKEALRSSEIAKEN